MTLYKRIPHVAVAMRIPPQGESLDEVYAFLQTIEMPYVGGYLSGKVVLMGDVLIWGTRRSEAFPGDWIVKDNERNDVYILTDVNFKRRYEEVES